MKRMHMLLGAIVVSTLGCTGAAGLAEPSAPAEVALPGTPVMELKERVKRTEPVFTVDPLARVAEAEEARVYLAQLAPLLVRRELEPSELEALRKDGRRAIQTVLAGWMTSEGLQDAARSLIEDKLSVSGVRDGVNFDLPGNLAAYVVRQQLPWKTVLTADYCVDASGAHTPCDSGSPFTAGVLTTRAFLMSRASRFNLTRAGTMLKAFACRDYPMETTLQPNLDKAMLIPLFAASTAAEQTDPRAEQGFGNGGGCLMCHAQFGAHAQLFVKFDKDGVYRPDADGQQDPAGELGRSTNGLYVSHLQDPVQARSERSQMFGVNVDNLRDAAWVLGNSPAFTGCQVRNLIEFVTGIHSTTFVSSKVLAEVTAAATDNGKAQPTFPALMLHTFSHPRVIEAVTAGAGGTP